MKRYFMEYDSDMIRGGSKSHVYGFASTIKTAKGYISRCKKNYAKDNPHNFRIYDTQGETPEGEHVPCIYSEP